MMPHSVGRFPHGFAQVFAFILTISLSQAQNLQPYVPAQGSPAAGHSTVRDPPVYVGSYLSDGIFRTGPRSARADSMDRLSTLRSNPAGGPRMRPSEVPGFINLHPKERVIENYQPPNHAKVRVRRRHFLAWLRDDIVTLAYGRERALLAPHNVTVDSRGRAIVSDPAAQAVHVLDGDKSFRIAAGASRRLHVPSGVAVDAEDNIYVTDSDLGEVVVYDRNGTFLHSIGRIGNESLFHAPTSIAIDRKHGRLYMLDSPRQVLFMLDLQGNILKRVGKSRGPGIGRYAGVTISMDLREPTGIALGDGKLAVLDSGGTRIQVMDLECNLLGEFPTLIPSDKRTAHEIGLGIDSAGNIYVTDLGAVRIYDQQGHLKDSFGRLGGEAGQFNAPSGLWIDATDRIYIADTNNQRVQVFQLVPSSTDSGGGAE